MSTTPSADGPAARAWQHRASELGRLLPSGFQVGTSSAAFSIEGAAREGGRGDSVWDAFTTQPGRIRDGSNASVASDHVHRLAEDLTSLRELGGDVYRFAFAWARLQPNGRGALNAQGIAFYDRLLDGLLASGISPMATLFHWDTPLALRGGWRNRDTAGRFGDYAYAAGEVFGDRIDSWVTLAEPGTVALNGYGDGTHAPGDALLFGALPVAHHLLLGHGIAVQGLRAANVRGRIGITTAYAPVQPASDREADRVYAELYDTLHNRMVGDAVLLGRYPEVPEFARQLRALTDIDPADLVTIHQPLDFYGVAYTGPVRVAENRGSAASNELQNARPEWPFRVEPMRECPATSSGAAIAPEQLAEALADLAARYGDALPPLYLSAGASFADTVDAWGEVTDVARIDYLAEHLAAAVSAAAPGGRAAGVDIRGFLVPLLDGFEWEAGYTRRFGLIHVDRVDQTRTAKESYRWLQRVLSAR